MASQLSSRLLLIRPANFGFNEETSESNSFQISSKSELDSIQKEALAEFNTLVELLKDHKIDLLIFDDKEELQNKDAIFPNNWFCTLPNGMLSIHPMHALNRRKERREDIIQSLQTNFQIQEFWDLSKCEEENQALEGTGSMVFDHLHKTAYACISPRTNEELFAKYCEEIKYEAISFTALDKQERAIYHTNVLLHIGNEHAVICLECIPNLKEREQLRTKLASNRDLIEISFEQLKNFCGNILQVKNREGDQFIILSKTAFESFLPHQLDILRRSSDLIIADITSIQQIGGGSVRCMIAEIFLNRN